MDCEKSWKTPSSFRTIETRSHTKYFINYDQSSESFTIKSLDLCRYFVDCTLSNNSTDVIKIIQLQITKTICMCMCVRIWLYHGRKGELFSILVFSSKINPHSSLFTSVVKRNHIPTSKFNEDSHGKKTSYRYTY